MSAILVFAEQRNGTFKKASFEATAHGRRLAEGLGGDVAAVCCGNDLGDKVAEIGHYGADKVLVASGEKFAHHSSAAVARAIVEAARACSPRAILLPATAMGKELAPLVAAGLGTSVAMDCTDVTVENGKLRIVRPVYAGKLMATLEATREPAVLTLRPNVFSAGPPDTSRSAVVENLAVDPTPEDMRNLVREIQATSSGEKIELTEADIIVAGGRGMKGPEHFALLEELAGALGAAVGASRAVVDAGWRPHGDQVGQTGKTVSPTLYFACGISGAIQHVAGMSSSKVIVAINKDADAPIFKIAGYGIVGDVLEVLPALTAALR